MRARPEYLRAREVAELLNLSERTVRRWIADGTLPSVKIGGARLVPVDEIRRLPVPPRSKTDVAETK
jgi:excisionase family DNA binding protein